VGGLILFGIPAVKDGRGSAADDQDGIIQAALRDVAAEVGDDIVIMADLCLCEYTDHGHCGVLTPSGPWTTTPRWSGTPQPRWRRPAPERTSSPRAG
jgi:Delta-aminolevulinic acid dehydratase